MLIANANMLTTVMILRVQKVAECREGSVVVTHNSLNADEHLRMWEMCMLASYMLLHAHTWASAEKCVGGLVTKGNVVRSLCC